MSWLAHNGESVVRYGMDVAKGSTRVSDKNFIVVLWWSMLVLLMRKSVSKAWIVGEEQSVETRIRCLFTTNCLHTLVLVANYAHCVVACSVVVEPYVALPKAHECCTRRTLSQNPNFSSGMVVLPQDI